MHEADITVALSEEHAGGMDCTRARPDIVLELLHELRASQYRPAAWKRFAVRSWRMSQQTARTHPHLVRSWRRVALGLTLLEGAMLIAEARTGGVEGLTAARRAAPGAALCLAYTLADAYVHLGLNNDEPGAPLRDTLGLPIALTLTRGAAAGLLIGHLLGGAPASRAITCMTLTTASITDIADGRLARRLNRVTRLGAYLDSETDFGIGLALTLTLRAQRRTSPWLEAGLLVRWLAPFTYALMHYFGKGSRMRIGSTLTGKAAGVAQTVALGLALVPEEVTQRAGRLRRFLEVVTALLLIAAPFAQFVRTWRR